jgi:hypothetical protein
MKTFKAIGVLARYCCPFPRPRQSTLRQSKAIGLRVTLNFTPGR